MNHDKPPVLHEFSVKPKVLYVADLPDGDQDIKGRRYSQYLSHFDIDIGYSRQGVSPYWEDMLRERKYDVVCCNNIPNTSRNQPAKFVPLNLGARFNTFYEELLAFIREQNKLGTQVVLTQDHADRQDIRRYAAFNALAANNPTTFASFERGGFQGVYKTYDGIDLNVFGPDVPILKRRFKVFFTSSVVQPEHKGHAIWQEVKDILSSRKDIEFVEHLSDSFTNKTPEQMNDLYNSCKVFVCLSISENGFCDLHHAAACGVVPITTKVGYAEHFKNLFIIDRRAMACVEKILYLNDHQDLLAKMSHGINKEVLPWDMKLMSRHWGHFIQQTVLKKKAIRF